MGKQAILRRLARLFSTEVTQGSAWFAIVFLLLTVASLVGVFSTGQTEPGSLARWSTSLPLLVAITTIQGVNPGKEGPMAPVDILDLVESYVYTCISLLMLAGRRVWP